MNKKISNETEMFRKKGKKDTKIKCMQFESKEECLKGKEMDGTKKAIRK